MSYIFFVLVCSVVLDQGRVVQDGTYAELAAQPGLFQSMVQVGGFAR